MTEDQINAELVKIEAKILARRNAGESFIVLHNERQKLRKQLSVVQRLAAIPPVEIAPPVDEPALAPEPASIAPEGKPESANNK